MPAVVVQEQNVRPPVVIQRENYPPYSVLMSVYQKEHPDWLIMSVESMMAQTVSPHDIVMVEDGPLTPELYTALDKLEETYPCLLRVPLEKNVGLGPALAEGVLHCPCELIARMDTDDYAYPTRCQEQLDAMRIQQADMVGSNVIEFIDALENITARRIMPETHEEIVRFSRSRTPLVHPTILFKKTVVLDAGNYRRQYLVEDYDLIVRMLRQGAKAYNVQNNLVAVRGSKDFYMRRGGIPYLKSLLNFNKQLLQCGWYTPKDYLIRSGGNVVLCLLPNQIRDWTYRRFLRK